MSKHARRADSNHAEIVGAFRSFGAAVVDVHSLPGALDLLVGFGGRLVLVEVKDGSKPPSARKLTPAEVETIEMLRAVGAPTAVVEHVGQVAAVLGLE